MAAVVRGVYEIWTADDCTQCWDSRSFFLSFFFSCFLFSNLGFWAGICADLWALGQLRLKASSVLIIGAGGLGCPAAAYIAGAGVGTLGIVDGDEVEMSNLHRQILHSTARVGMKKVDSAIEYLKSFVILFFIKPLNYPPYS